MRWLARLTVAVIAGALLAAGAACQSSSTNVLGPSGTKCGISLPTTLPSIGPAGGAGTFTVTVSPECVWRASSDADWISITSNATGQGTGVVGFVASGNPTAAMRRGAVRVGESRAELAQGGAPCQFNLTPATETFDTAGGEGVISVAVIEGCQWTATSNTSWLSVVGTPSATGSGSVRYRTQPNIGSTRSGTLTIADRTFAVNQAGTGTPCAIAIDRSEQSIGASGGEDLVVVTSAGECPWSATSLASWITISSGATGTGNGTVRLNVAPNSGGVRVGLVTITGHTYVVTQAGATGTCFYAIGATGQAAPAAASAGTVVVSASSGCSWAAVSQASWISITGGAAGNGSGVVVLSIAQNTAAERVGRVIVAGYSYTITQQAAATTAPCSYSINATQLSAPASGGGSTVAVTAGGECGWTAVSQAAWISVTSGASGSGNGTVQLTVAANTGPARSGVVTIAGQTYTVTQAAAPVPCSYALSASDQASPASGGTATVGVTAANGCGWTAESQVPWITVANGAAGSGNGSVQLTIAANATAQRVGTVVVAGHTFTITQAPGACTFSLNPTAQTVSLLGGDFSVAVTTQAGCRWTATSADDWIQLSSSNTGVGSGTLSYRVPLVSLGLLFSRTGTIAISGSVLTVNQRALLGNDR